MAKRLYHVSPGYTRPSIMKFGIDSRHSMTRRAEIWLVRSSELQWAFEHVANRHSCDIHECLAYCVTVDDAKNRGHGRFTVTGRIKVTKATEILDFSDVYSEALFKPGEDYDVA